MGSSPNGQTVDRNDRPALLPAIASVATAVTVVVMILIYLGQQKDQEQVRRRETATAMLLLKYDGNLRASQQRVTEFIIASQSMYAAALKAKSERQTFPLQALPSGIRGDMQTIVDYYTDVVACSEKNLCDKAMIDIWFREDMRSFVGNACLIGLPELRVVFGAEFGSSITRYAGQCP